MCSVANQEATEFSVSFTTVPYVTPAAKCTKRFITSDHSSIDNRQIYGDYKLAINHNYLWYKHCISRHLHCSVVTYFADCFIISDQPEITVHPQTVAKPEGDNVTLSCNATANPIATISWTRNGSPVNTTINSKISFSEDNKQLTITDVNRTDSGEYRCVASNSLGNDTSNVATLDVQCKYSILLSTFLTMISSMLLH